MLDIRAWLEATGYKVADTAFVRQVDPPYLVYLVRSETRGGDDWNAILMRSITIELYSDTVNEAAESALEMLLNNLPAEYGKERIWIGSENHFETIYDFTLIEKIT